MTIMIYLHTLISKVTYSFLLFVRTWVDAEKVEQVCGESYQCKYDYSTTLNQEFALFTKHYQDQFINIREGVLKPEVRGKTLLFFNFWFLKWTFFISSIFMFLNNYYSFLCLVVSCGILQTPQYGRKSTFAFTPGTMVKFDCNPGYVLTGERRRWCYDNGDWNWAENGEANCMRKCF